MEKILGRGGEFSPGLGASEVETFYPDEDMEGDYQENPGLDALVSEGEEGFYPEEEAYEEEEIAFTEEERSKLREEIIEEARIEAEAEADELRQKAYEEGVAKADEEMQHMRDNLLAKYDQRRQDLEAEFAEKMGKMESDMADVFLDVITDVLHVDILDYKKIIIDLVKSTLLKIDNPKEVGIMVNEENYNAVKAHLPFYKEMLGDEVKLDVLKNTQLSNSQCKIETEFGVYDCGFDTQLENLTKRIKVLSHKR